MTDGFDHGAAALSRPRPPSIRLFVAVAALAVALVLAAACLVATQRNRAATVRADAVLTANGRTLLFETIARVECAQTAALLYRATGDPATLRHYRALRVMIARDLAGLARAMAGRPADVARLRGLIAAQFDAIDLQPPSAQLVGLSRDQARRVAGLGSAIDGAVATLSRAQAIQLAKDGALSEAAFRTVGNSFLLVAVAAIFAAVFGVWMSWRSRCRHHRLELGRFDAMARSQAVFAGTSEAIVILDRSGRIEETNAAAGQLFGYAVDEIVGQDVSRLFDFDYGDMPLAQRAGFGSARVALPLRIERMARRRDGSMIPVEIALGTMQSADGHRIVASVRDVSARQAAERTKDDFISTISHELRTPLTSVVGALGLLREGAAGALPDAAARLTDIAENNSRRLIRLVNDILDIDRLGSGRITLDVGPLDLRATAARARDDAEGIAAPRAVKLVLDAPDTPVTVAGDAERLLQVIGNLLSNAVRFSPPGGTVTLTLTAEHRGGDALVRVDDEGPGVPAEFRERLFGRFNQSSAGAAIPGGTGLGLAISREIVRAHHGDIWYAEGGGARFCFSLPLIASEPVDSRRRLLLCEDDTRIAALLREMIEDEGYLVDRCGSAAEACRMARTGRYDALLLDLTLPDAEGLDAVRMIRDQPETIMLPVVVISGSASYRRIDPEATALGVVAWIDKPVNHGLLLRALDAAIRYADSNRPVLLHVEDDPDVRQVVALALADRGRILQAGSLASARAALAACAPAAAILDLDLPDGSGLDLLPLLADGPHGRIPTVIYTAGLDLPPVGGPIEVVLVKSVRSPLVLSETIGALLNRQPVSGEGHP